MKDFERVYKTHQMMNLMTMGYSKRHAAIAVGLTPSTGRRWLKDQLEIEQHEYEEMKRRQPDRPDDIPF